MKEHPVYQNLLQFDSFKKFKALFHFSTTIKGGMSQGSYATFNLGEYAGDNRQCILKNRQRLSEMIGIVDDNLITPYQIHGDKVLIIDNDFLSKSKEERTHLLNGVDAVVTNLTDICIGVSTADCVPILIFDPIRNVLAAIHAGWRGTVAKIAEKAICFMVQNYACNTNDLIAGIAPSISPEYFEVGSEVVDSFDEAGFMIEDFGYRNAQTGKMHIDLWSANEFLLTKAGIPFDKIEIAGLCTYSNPHQFFSARRQGIDSGRMLTGGILRSNQ